MAAEISLFSRAQPGKPQPKKTLGFLDLPGETRNRIYHYYFQDSYRCEIAAKGHDFGRKPVKQPSIMAGVQQKKRRKRKQHDKPPVFIRISRSLGGRNAIQGLQTKWSTSLCPLILVCKQVHTETHKTFYNKVTFVFQAPRQINNFLGAVSKLCLRNITKMHLHYVAYGYPMQSNDCIWLEKHRRSWKMACRSASKKLVGLQELEIWIYANHPAPKLNLYIDWIKPVLQFRKMTTASKIKGTKLCVHELIQPALKQVNIHVNTNTVNRFANKILIKASTDLHRLFGRAISLAILGYTEEEAMAEFNEAWTGRYKRWQYHLGYGKINW